MLTVTIKAFCGTHRTIEAREVSANNNNSSGYHDELVISLPNGEIERHYEGEFFVMNEGGATVARYHMAPSLPKVAHA